jgi:hypothetical protein
MNDTKKPGKSPHPLLDDFDKRFIASMKKQREDDKGPKKFDIDVAKGHYMRDVDPKDADRHLE